MKQETPKGVTVKQETKYDDGNYSALIGVYGFEFAVSATNAGEVNVFGTGYKNRHHTGPRWKLTGAAKIARDFTEQRVAL